MCVRPISGTTGRKNACSVWLLSIRSEFLIDYDLRAGESLDELILGNLKIIQPRRGYRFSIDAVLLAHFPDVAGIKRIVELGSGNGVVSLLTAWRAAQAQVTAVEIQPAMAERSRRSVLLNGLQERIDIIEADIKNIEEILPGGEAELVLSNPPFWRKGEGKVSREQEEAIARHEIKLSLPELAQKGAYLLASGGTLDIIHRAERLDEIMTLFRKHNLPVRKLRFVHGFADREAKLVMIEGVKNRPGSLKVMPPLIIYERVGSYSQELRQLYGG